MWATGQGERKEQPEGLDQVGRARLVDQLGVAQRHVDGLEAIGDVPGHADQPGQHQCGF
jgi:hypothetical protein